MKAKNVEKEVFQESDEPPLFHTEETFSPRNQLNLHINKRF